MEHYSKSGIEKINDILGEEHANRAIDYFEKLSPEFSRCLVDYVVSVA